MMGNWIADSATIAETARGKVLLIGERLISCKENLNPVVFRYP